jgi:hypothetical protein
MFARPHHFQNNTTNGTLLQSICKYPIKVLTRPIKTKLAVGRYILNLDQDLEDETYGTHFVAFLVTKDACYYFDSYGVGPFREIYTNHSSSVKPLIYNDKCIQHIDSTACGYFCVAFLNTVNNYADFTHFINQFDADSSKNDKLLKTKFDLPVKI